MTAPWAHNAPVEALLLWQFQGLPRLVLPGPIFKQAALIMLHVALEWVKIET